MPTRQLLSRLGPTIRDGRDCDLNRKPWALEEGFIGLDDRRKKKKCVIDPSLCFPPCSAVLKQIKNKITRPNPNQSAGLKGLVEVRKGDPPGEPLRKPQVCRGRPRNWVLWVRFLGLASVNRMARALGTLEEFLIVRGCSVSSVKILSPNLKGCWHKYSFGALDLKSEFW